MLWTSGESQHWLAVVAQHHAMSPKKFNIFNLERWGERRRWMPHYGIHIACIVRFFVARSDLACNRISTLTLYVILWRSSHSLLWVWTHLEDRSCGLNKIWSCALTDPWTRLWTHLPYGNSQSPFAISDWLNNPSRRKKSACVPVYGQQISQMSTALWLNFKNILFIYLLTYESWGFQFFSLINSP